MLAIVNDMLDPRVYAGFQHDGGLTTYGPRMLG